MKNPIGYTFDCTTDADKVQDFQSTFVDPVVNQTSIQIKSLLNKAGRTREDLSRPIFVDRPNRYVCGINFYAIPVGRLKSVNIKLF